MNSAVSKPTTGMTPAGIKSAALKSATLKSAAITNKSVGQPSAVSKHSFVAFDESNVHEHDHRLTPHIHSFECDRYSSGNDQNRNCRFYFTKNTTAVRVYMNYNEKLLMPSIDEVRHDGGGGAPQFNSQLNGRKLSPRTLRNQLRLSQKFIEDARNLIFLNDSLSLVPPGASVPNVSNNLPLPLTMAEMAVLPFHQMATTSAVTTSKTKMTSRN
jgi:hypothetical protein